MRKIKGFSYDPLLDQEVIEHIDRQQNRSRYIWELVRKDIKNSNIEDYIKMQVNKHLEEMAEKIKNPNKV